MPIRAVPLALALGLVLLGLPFASAEPSQAAEPSGTGLPADVSPLPAELAERVQELAEAAEKYRGLEAKRPVPSGVIEESALRAKVAEEMRREMPPEALRAVGAGLQAFGLLPADLDLARYYPELLTSQVAGYYDPLRKYLAVVYRNGGLLGGAGRAGEEGQLEEMVLVHELTHALQDQHFDLQAFVRTEPLADAGAARLALVEGDAALTMLGFQMGMPMESVPGAERILSSLDPEKLLAAGADLPGARELARAPAWLRDTMLFSYLEGYSFCLSARMKGGQALLDHAFRQDPPRSSEQILHPEKWHTRRDDPVALAWPDLSDRLRGFRKVTEGELGELGIRILLREATRDAGRASAAAAGWGGDRFALYEKAGRRVLAWITEWDTEAEAREMLAAAKGLDRLGGGWRVELVSPRRVVVLRWAKKGELAGLTTGLAAAPARRPENRDIDLASVGGGEKKAPQEADPAALLGSPAVQQAMRELAGQEKPAGKLGEDGRTYTNAAVGFSITLPPSRRDWTLQPEPPLPMSLLLVESPDKAARILFSSLDFPGSVSAEEVKPLLELGLKAALPGYRSLGGQRLDHPAASAWEERFEAAPDGQKSRGLLRLYGREGSLLMVVATVPEDRWERYEPALLEVLGGLMLTGGE